MDPKGTLLVLGHIRAPKGHSALWKRPSENPGGQTLEGPLPNMD